MVLKSDPSDEDSSNDSRSDHNEGVTESDDEGDVTLAVMENR